MPLQLEQQARDGGIVRIAMGADERKRVVVRAGDTFRFVDDAGQIPVRMPRLQVRRLDDNLIVDGLPDARSVVLYDFFKACGPGAECKVELDGLGVAGLAITELTASRKTLDDGSLLLYRDDSDLQSLATALPLVKLVDVGTAAPSFAAVGGTVAGAAVAGAAVAGGGGGSSAPPPAPASAPVDTTPPAAPVVTSADTLKRAAAIVTGTAEASSTLTLWIDVDGNGRFDDASDLRYTATTDAAGLWQVNLAGTPAQGTLPPGGLADGQRHAMRVQATDAAQNASTQTSGGVTLDGTSATPTIATVAGDDVVDALERTAGITVSGTAEAGATVAVSVGGATAAATASASGAWSVGFTTAQLPPDGSAVAQAIATDALGNVSAPGTRAFTIDATAPGTPTITDGTAGTASGPVTFTLTFDEPVTGVAASNLVVTGGTPGAFVAVSPSVYTLVVTPSAATQAGTIVVGLAAGAGADLAGNPTPAAVDATQPYDTLAPSVSIADDVPGATASGTVVFTFAFAEPVTGFDVGDLVVTGVPAGSVGTLAQTGAATFTLPVTPPADSSGTIAVTMPAGAAFDAAGNPSVAPPSASQAFNTDTTPPVLTIGGASGTAATGPVVFTFGWSEAVTGFTLADLSPSGLGAGTLGAFAGSGASYTATFTPAAGEAGTLTLTVPSSAATDLNGVASVASASTTQAYDRQAPTLSSITDNASGIATGPVTFTFDWSEAITGFDAADVVIGGDGAGTFGPLTGSGTTYSMQYTPSVGETSAVTLSVGAAVAVDAAGNVSTGTRSTSQSFVPPDPAPTLVITSDQAGTVSDVDPTVRFTFTFSESVSDFTFGDLQLSGAASGTFGALVGGPTVYTLDYTPAAGSVGLLGITVPASAAFDGSGQFLQGGASITQPYDREASLAITDSVSATAASGPVTFTFTLSDVATDFDIGDIGVTAPAGSTVGPLLGSGSAYSLTVTPPTDTIGQILVNVGANAFTDPHGNGSTGAFTSQNLNTNVRPVLQSITDDTTGTATGPVVFTFTWSEPVVGFDISDITRTGASTGALTGFGGSGAVYSVTYTPVAGEAGNLVLAVPSNRVTDAAAVPNFNASTVSAPAQPYDLLPPTQTVTSSSGGGTPSTPATITLTLNTVLAVGDTVVLSRSGLATPLSPTSTSGATLGFTDATLAAGSYSYTATIADSLGNARQLDFNTVNPGIDPFVLTI